MTVFAYARRFCPYCGAVNSTHVRCDPQAPARVETSVAPPAGHVSVCWTCRNVAMFTECGLRKLTSDEHDGVLRAREGRALLHALAESDTAIEAVVRARHAQLRKTR